MSTLFVEADEPLLVFPSVEVAQRYLEAEDVRSGTYPRAYGVHGELFSIGASGDVVLITAVDAPPDPAGLAALLHRSLAAVSEAAPADADLPELVSRARAFWRELDPDDERFSRAVPWWGCLLAVIAMTACAAFLLR